VYHYFATLLEYPAPGLFPALEGAIGALRTEFPESAVKLVRFRESAAPLTIGALEELYIRTFEMRGETALYVGHQMFDEDRRRGLFMAGLRDRYRVAGMAETGELPDHLGMILRYLDLEECGEEQERDELIGDCVFPAVRRIMQAIESKSPYHSVLDALLLCLPPPAHGESTLEEILCRPSSLSHFPILR